MRYEFSACTKRDARKGAGGVCMAEGPVYGLSPKTRCTVILVAGNHEYDHWPIPAHVEGSNTIANCMVVCKVHHAWKSTHFDTPAEAKIKRVQRSEGTRPDNRKPKPVMHSRGFDKSKTRKFSGKVVNR